MSLKLDRQTIMLTNLQNLIEEIRLGKALEHRHPNLELKEDWVQKHGEKLSALGNKTEQPVSWLVVGMTNEGKLVGRDENWAKQREEVISQQINENLDPIQACKGVECRE